MPIDELVPWEKNPRKNDGKPVSKVAKSIREFGFVAPICVWKSRGRMVAGHTRLKALRAILAEEPDFIPKGAPQANVAPVRFHEFEDEAQAEAYAIADNRLGEEAEWANDQLAAIYLDIQSRGTSETLDAIGFDRAELLKILPEPPLSGEDNVPDVPKVPVSRSGDLWILGRHRVLCGDSTHANAVAALMGGEKATLLWTDPPYNVAYVGKTKEALTIDNDSMADEEFRAFLGNAFRAANAVLAPGAAFYIAHADSEGYNFRGAVRDVGWKFAQCLIWVKDVFVMGRQDYHWRHEPILYGWKLGAGHHALADRTQDTVWEIPRPKRSTEHPTMKPPELISRAMHNSSDADAIVLDLFGGSGSTLVAAETTGRSARLLELDPRYCDVIVERWQNLTGQKASRANTKAA